MIPAALISIARPVLSFLGFGRTREPSEYELSRPAECAALAKQRAALGARIERLKRQKKATRDLQGRLDYLTNRQLCIELDMDAAAYRSRKEARHG